jgi:hypothetical protein
VHNMRYQGEFSQLERWEQVMDVKVRQHQWVAMKITPVEVLPGLNPGDEPVVIVDPDKDQASNEVTQYGCFACLAALTGETLTVECPGESDE